ncbi:MAG TPA: hypothetical protein VKB58_16485 [Terriglobales bacterium]|nr:hypothetical protein [Terriglobales bacterium]
MANEETTDKAPSPDDLVNEADSIELDEKEVDSVSGGDFVIKGGQQ